MPSRRVLGTSSLRRTACAAAAAVAIGGLAAGCGGGSSAVPSTSATTQAPLPAGRNPSAVSRQVCSAEAQREMASALGVTATVSPPTWQDHVYSCTYRYPNGSFTLSVKELSSWAETTAYFAALRTAKGTAERLGSLGQEAFQGNDGTVVVRKGFKVLTVDIAGLPAEFAVPPTPKDAIAVTVADVILGCWNGD